MTNIHNYKNIDVNPLLPSSLLQKVDTDIKKEEISYPLHDAVKAKDTTAIISLVQVSNFPINSQNKEGKTPLSIAAKLQDTKLIELLLQLGANIDATFVHNQTVLHQVAYDKDFKICNFLLERGANPNIMQSWSYFYATGTPLHIAISKNSAELVELLIKYHANVNLRNEWGETPLHTAAYYGAKEAVINTLVQAGAHINKTNGLNNWTAPGSPLHVAADKGHLDTLSALLKNGADINLLNEKHETAVMIAVENRKVDALKLLLKYSPQLSVTNEEGLTAMDIASRMAQSGNAKGSEMLQLLLNT